VVKHLEDHCHNKDTGVACLYLNYKEGETQTPTNLLASLCKQLLLNKSISPLLQGFYKHHCTRDTKPSLDEVSQVLCTAVSQYSKIYLVIDALDEYPEDQRNMFLGYLSKVILGTPIINMLMTSRPNVALDQIFPDLQVSEIRAADQDIQQFVDMQIQKSSRLSRHIQTQPELHEEIKSKIVSIVKGM
jgi:hypothetical protein